MSNQHQKTAFLIMLLVISCLLFVQQVVPVQAQEKKADDKGLVTCSDCQLGDFGVLLTKIAGYLLSIAGSLALLMFIYGGFTWLSSGGNKEGVQKGKNILVSAAIGIVIVFAAFLAVNFTLKELTGSTEVLGVDGNKHPWYQLSK